MAILYYDPVKTLPEFIDDGKLARQFEKIAEKTDKGIVSLLNDKNGIGQVISRLKEEKDWRRIRCRLAILNDYGSEVCLTEKQKVLEQLLSMLVHPNRTVRKLSAVSLGRFFAGCDPFDTDLCEWFFRKLFFSESFAFSQDKEQMGAAVKTILGEAFGALQEKEKKIMLNVYASYFKSARWDPAVCFSLIAGIEELPYGFWNHVQLHYICGFLRRHLVGEQEEIRLLSLRLIKRWLEQGALLSQDMIEFLKGLELSGDGGSEDYLLVKIWEKISYESEKTDAFVMPGSSELIWKNLRFMHSGVRKVINLMILKERAQMPQEMENEQRINLEKYATHLLNLLRLSTEENIFIQAGEDLVEVMPRLETNQKNEIIQEVLKDYELGGDSTNYVPSFMERAYFYLTIEEQKEFFSRFLELYNNTDLNVVKTTLEIAGRILKNFPLYQEGNREEKEERKEIFCFFAGLLCRGMVHYRRDVAEEALYLMKDVACACKRLDKEIFREDVLWLMRKTLFSVSQGGAGMLKGAVAITQKRAAECLEYHADSLQTAKKEKKKIAFFSASFNPFSLDHKAIIKEIADMGFEVYLSVAGEVKDEPPCPAKIRRQMIDMSVAELKDVFVFPESVSLNLGKSGDLTLLQKIFDGRELYIVMGTEEIENNEAYWGESEKEEIYKLPHIFYAGSDVYEHLDNYAIGNMIQNEVLYLRLPASYQKKTSKTVRRRMREGKSIKGYLSEQVIRMIEEMNLYQSF